MPQLLVPLHRDPTRAAELVDNLLANPAKARSIFIDALVAASSLVDTVNATGGLVRNEDHLLVPSADKDWIDLGAAAMTASCALVRAGLPEELVETHD